MLFPPSYGVRVTYRDADGHEQQAQTQGTSDTVPLAYNSAIGWLNLMRATHRDLLSVTLTVYDAIHTPAAKVA